MLIVTGELKVMIESEKQAILSCMISSYENATNKVIDRNGLLCQDCFLRINFNHPLTLKVPEPKYLSMKNQLGSKSCSNQVSKTKSMSTPITKSIPKQLQQNFPFCFAGYS